jgi:hypothetical protein
MNKLLTTAFLATMALPVFADEGQPATPRLDQLETIVVTTQKDEPASTRLRDLEIVTITAEKQQPADYVVEDKIAALLAEIDAEE